MKYKICIPTFDRPTIIKERTLKLLEDNDINFNIVDIFLENQNQYDKYYECLKDDEKYHDLNIIITDTTGIGQKRNFIRNYYRYIDTEIKNIISIDDDMEQIIYKDENKVNLKLFFDRAFTILETENLNLWGLTASQNPFFMKDGYSRNLKYIPGNMFGFVVDSNKEVLQTSYNHYEDFEFSILHFKRDGGVIRFNDIGFRTKFFEKGGINLSYGGLEKRKADMKIAGDKFIEEYRGIAKLKENKWGYGLLLNHRYKGQSL